MEILICSVGALMIAVAVVIYLTKKLKDKDNEVTTARALAERAQTELAHAQHAQAELAHAQAELAHAQTKSAYHHADAILAKARHGENPYFESLDTFLDMVKTVDSVGGLFAPVDFQQIQERITRRSSSGSMAPTDRYFDEGELHVSRPSRSERDSLTNNQNDFSRFRRWMVANNNTQDAFDVDPFYPNDDALERVVLTVLFDHDQDRFRTFMSEMAHLRDLCLKFLNSDTVKAFTAQRVFMIFADALLKALPRTTLCVQGINRLPLSATLTVRAEIHGQAAAKEKTLSGFADVGFLSSADGAVDAKHIRVVGEIKANLRNPTAFAEKDQLLIEMEALRQLQPPGRRDSVVVKGFLTDLFCLNIAVLRPTGKGRRVFMVAPRVWEHRPFLVRLLFLLCDPLAPQLWDSVTQRSPVGLATVRSGLRSTEKKPGVPANPPNAKTKARPSKRRRGKKPISKTTKRPPPTPSDESSSIIWFKRADDSDEYDKECEELSRWWHRYQHPGEPYLCAENLEAMEAAKEASRAAHSLFGGGP
jgi:hypothetical protein